MMTRIIVVSDTHRDYKSLERLVLMHKKTADLFIHLGDGADEAEMVKAKFPEKTFLQVRGNCDWGCDLPVDAEITLEGKKIFYTHGYTHNVKYGLYNMCCAAREKKADIVLFGHTHQALAEYDDGLYLLNPGSLHGSMGTYGIIDGDCDEYHPPLSGAMLEKRGSRRGVFPCLQARAGRGFGGRPRRENSTLQAG